MVLFKREGEIDEARLEPESYRDRAIWVHQKLCAEKYMTPHEGRANPHRALFISAALVWSSEQRFEISDTLTQTNNRSYCSDPFFRYRIDTLEPSSDLMRAGMNDRADVLATQCGGQPFRHKPIHDLHALDVTRGGHDLDQSRVDRQRRDFMIVRDRHCSCGLTSVLPFHAM